MKFEYKILETKVSDLEKGLNDLGSQGWQISYITEISPSMMRVYLQRQAPIKSLTVLGE